METSDRSCPHDRRALTPIQVDGLALDTCADCGGLWFDHGELREAENHADGDFAWLEFTLWRDEEHFDLKPTRLACPRRGEGCAGTLGTVLYHDTGVLVHICGVCHGTWLDHGDLERIVTRLRHELDDLRDSSVASASLAEAAHLATHPGRLAEEWKDLKGLVGLLGKRIASTHHGLIARLAQAAKDTPFG